jgi:HPt (histidine-containing phosphotransfer) domain-containing protein
MPARIRLAAVLMRHLPHCPLPRTLVPRSAEAGAARSSPAVLLDPQALQRLHDLDPTGATKLMDRVVAAFGASVARLIPLLHSAQKAGDAAAVRLVAHTLKSSSSSVGAVRLSQLCADMEAAAKQGRTAELPEAIAALSTEVTAVLDALEHTHHSYP